MTENMPAVSLAWRIIEDRMSEDIITGKIKRGNKVIISTKNKQISLTVE